MRRFLGAAGGRGRAMLALLPLRIDGAWLAIEAASVVELVAPAHPPARRARAGAAGARLPRARGATLNLGLLLGGSAALASAAPRSRTVIVAVGASTLALPVDAAREVLDVGPCDLGRSPASLQHWAARAVTLDDGPAPANWLNKQAADLRATLESSNRQPKALPEPPPRVFAGQREHAG